MSTRSIGAKAGPARKLVAFAQAARTPRRPRARILARHTATAVREESTSTTSPAPRLAASRPSAPEPAHRSSTRVPSSAP